MFQHFNAVCNVQILISVEKKRSRIKSAKTLKHYNEFESIVRVQEPSIAYKWMRMRVHEMEMSVGEAEGWMDKRASDVSK